MYFIHQFGFVNNSNANLLITRNTTINISNKDMVSVLNRLGGGEQAQCLSEEKLSYLLKINNISSSAGLDFLHDVGVIERVEDELENNFPFSSVCLITDISDTKCLIDNMMNDGIDFKSSVTFENYDKIKPEDNSLVVVYSEKYCQSRIKKIYAKYAKVKGIAFIQAYYMREEFKIDGFYSPDLGTPCHFCHIGRWRSREKRSFSSDKTSWGDVIDFLEAKKINLPPSIHLQKTDRYFSFHILRRKLQSLAGIPLTRVHLDEFCNSVTASLVRCEVSSEPIPHWHSCDCLYGEWN